MNEASRRFWMILVAVPLFMYASQAMLELEQHNDAGLLYHVYGGLVGASGFVILIGLLDLYVMASRDTDSWMSR